MTIGSIEEKRSITCLTLFHTLCTTSTKAHLAGLWWKCGCVVCAFQRKTSIESQRDARNGLILDYKDKGLV